MTPGEGQRATVCVCVIEILIAMQAGLMSAGCRGLYAAECLCVNVCVCVCVCACALLSQRQSLTPPWQVCGPSPPPTSPSAACPWPSDGQKTLRHTACRRVALVEEPHLVFSLIIKRSARSASRSLPTSTLFSSRHARKTKPIFKWDSVGCYESR